MRGNKVAVIDVDTGLRNLDLLLGLENRIMYDLVDVTSGRIPYKKALVRHRKYETLFLLPTSQVKNKKDIDPLKVIELCKEMIKEFDYILSGKLRFAYEDHIEELEPGDTLLYDSSRGHGMIAIGGEPCTFLALVMKPREESIS